MSARTWETDFRYAAILESINEFNSEQTDDFFSFPGSLCLPVAKKPIIGLTPGKIALIAIVLGFALLGGGLFVMTQAKANPNRQNGNFWLGFCVGVAGMTCFFLPLKMDRYILKLLIGARGRELASQPGKLLCAELSDPSMVTISVDCDDYVLLLADHANQRLLIEGIAARYQIRAQDVSGFQPIKVRNVLGVEITYRINEKVLLSISISRHSLLLELIDQLPFLFFLRSRIRNRILEVCKEALDLTPDEPAI